MTKYHSYETTTAPKCVTHATQKTPFRHRNPIFAVLTNALAVWVGAVPWHQWLHTFTTSSAADARVAEQTGARGFEFFRAIGCAHIQ